MITPLERFVMHIQEITSPYTVTPLVEYNGRLKLAFHQKNGNLLFIINYHFEFRRIIANVDFYFNDLENTYIDEEMQKFLIKILLVFFEDGDHQGISCNMKLSSGHEPTHPISLFSDEEYIIWNNTWDRVGYETSTKLTEFQTIDNLIYSSKISVIWKKDRNLEGDLYYYFFQEITVHSFESIFISQLNFQEELIEVDFIINDDNIRLIFYIENQHIIIKNPIVQKKIFSCINTIELHRWLIQYFQNKLLQSSNETVIQNTNNIQAMLQRCIGEVPNDKLEYFANNCFNYLDTKFPNENADLFIQENLETMEIFHLNERNIAITYKNYLLCISKSSNLSWMSQKEIEFHLIENK